MTHMVLKTRRTLVRQIRIGAARSARKRRRTISRIPPTVVKLQAYWQSPWEMMDTAFLDSLFEGAIAKLCENIDDQIVKDILKESNAVSSRSYSVYPDW